MSVFHSVTAKVSQLQVHKHQNQNNRIFLPTLLFTWCPEKVPDVKQYIILFKEIPLGSDDEEDAPVQSAYFVRQRHDTKREKYLDLRQSICSLSQCTLPCREYHMHRQQGIPLGVHALLWWPVLIRARRLCFHPSETDASARKLWSLLWHVPPAMRRDWGKHGRGADSCRCLQSAGMPDGVLIDFLVLSQSFITTSPSRCQRVCSGGLISLDSRQPKPFSDEHLLLACLRFDLWTRVVRGTVFGQRNADNGGDWKI